MLSGSMMLSAAREPYGLNGAPWSQQSQFNRLQSVDVSGYLTGTGPGGGQWRARSYFVTNGYVYACGGTLPGSNSASTVWRAPIDANGVVGTWTTTTGLNTIRGYSKPLLTKNRVYLLGGYSTWSNYVSSCATAAVNADGTLGAWSAAGPLPAAISPTQPVLTKTRAYICGGSGVNTSAVFYTDLNPDGTLGLWQTDISLPSPAGTGACFTTKNRVYVCCSTGTVYTAPIDVNGHIGLWTTAPSLPSTMTYPTHWLTKDRVWVAKAQSSSTVYTAPINADGTLGTWAIGTSLPAARQNLHALITSSRVYLIEDATPSTVTYYATFAGGKDNYMTEWTLGGGG